MKRIIFISIAILFFGSLLVHAADLKNSKIAVASSGKSEKTSVSNRAAKCPYYLIFDSKGELVEVVDNPYADASGGAGPSAADFLVKMGVTMFIAESFGSKMTNALKNNDITPFGFKGSVGDAVKTALEGRK
jgi:predicted Fe-Mo cluster-binding NifX family protein